MTDSTAPVALITGSAKRIGAAIATALHRAGYRVVIHHRNSEREAQQLCSEFNLQRSASAISVRADLASLSEINALAKQACSAWGRLDLLINNASSFYPTPIGTIDENQWDDLFTSNLKAPLFLAQALASELRRNSGCIINLADIHAERPLKDHTVYCCAKAGNVMLTKSLARELAPEVRVNGIAPGAILWPEDELSENAKRQIVERTALKRAGCESDIAQAVIFLANQAPYITGQIISVDGGRTLSN